LPLELKKTADGSSSQMTSTKQPREELNEIKNKKPTAK
jgi:hypothetical protein